MDAKPHILNTFQTSLSRKVVLRGNSSSWASIRYFPTAVKMSTLPVITNITDESFLRKRFPSWSQNPPRIQTKQDIPWLATHNPFISWKDSTLTSGRPHCRGTCIPFLSCTTKLDMQMSHIFIAKVCGKTKAAELPPYHPLHTSIDHTPGALSGWGGVNKSLKQHKSVYEQRNDKSRLTADIILSYARNCLQVRGVRESNSAQNLYTVDGVQQVVYKTYSRPLTAIKYPYWPGLFDLIDLHTQWGI